MPNKQKKSFKKKSNSSLKEKSSSIQRKISYEEALLEKKLKNKHWCIECVGDNRVDVQFRGKDITSYQLVWADERWSVWCKTAILGNYQVIAKLYGFNYPNIEDRKEDAFSLTMIFLEALEECSSFNRLWPSYLEKAKQTGETVIYKGKANDC